MLCSAGRRVGLLESFRHAGDALGIDLHVIACDLDPTMSAACARADIALQVPRADNPGYADAVHQIAEEHDVALIVPTIDPELLPLSQAADAFAATGTRVHVSPPSVIEVVRDKARTAEVFGAAGVPVPRTVDLDTLRMTPGALRWPVFAKPSGGSASRGLAVFDRIEDVPARFEEPMVFQDRLTGPEYTINMFIDASGTLQTVVPHLRLQIRAGEVEKGRTERRTDLRAIAERVAAALPELRGVACFQIIDDPHDGPLVFELNARFGGGFPLADHAGARFAHWLLEEVSGKPCSAHDDWRDGVEMLRYDAAVFRG